MPDHHPVRVLVTGFGAFQDVTTNPSFEILKRLPQFLPDIEIIAHPEPLRAAYHSLLKVSPQLIHQHDPDIVLHIGLAVERDYFAVERGACRDGYHQYPDVDRQVISKSERQKIWGKNSAERLDTSMDLERVAELWTLNFKQMSRSNKVKDRKGHQKSCDMDSAKLKLSDDVGDYVCGLVYYTSLTELAKRGEGRRNAVFLHVPPLSGEAEIEKGKAVVEALIVALGEVFQGQNECL
ncbi:hypothetical protein BGZ63DRAFT_43921 [Mariannaea sp. PMI_226]|nr:hypothetical protein BGZ63DRAFT_43921 [Mariannaea sp. PMI_226]